MAEKRGFSFYSKITMLVSFIIDRETNAYAGEMYVVIGDDEQIEGAVFVPFQKQGNIFIADKTAKVCEALGVSFDEESDVKINLPSCAKGKNLSVDDISVASSAMIAKINTVITFENVYAVKSVLRTRLNDMIIAGS